MFLPFYIGSLLMKLNGMKELGNQLFDVCNHIIFTPKSQSNYATRPRRLYVKFGLVNVLLCDV